MKKGLGIAILIFFEAIWLALLVFSFLYPDNLALAIFGVIAILFLMPFNHENGHLLFCLLTKTKVTSYRYMIFTFEKSSPNVRFRPSLTCAVSFIKGKHFKLICASGPLFDVLFFLIILVLFLMGPKVLSSYLLLSASALLVLLDLLPLRKSDIRRIFAS